MSCWAVIVAAGRGTRSGLSKNKVFFPVRGRSALARCLDVFEESELFDGIVLVLSTADNILFSEIENREGPFRILRQIVPGGKTRQDSVYSGLSALPEDCEIVAIHDAARPFVTSEIIDATVRSATKYGSGVICTPVVDTIKQIEPDGHVVSLDRDRLRAVQTPQSFDCRRIIDAHRRAQADGLTVTDDAMLFEYYYGEIHLVSAPHAEENRKLTTKADFDTLYNTFSDIRIGQGYDAHRLKDGRKLILCGLDVPYDKGLEGHSDADVAVHALMDALLGAIGMGDIGRRYPDNDQRFEGISSLLLLKDVIAEVYKAGYRVGNADVTIVAQQPKLAQYMGKMQQNLAETMDVIPERINVKATTTEHMGFEGDGTGISAHAVVLLLSGKK